MFILSQRGKNSGIILMVASIGILRAFISTLGSKIIGSRIKKNETGGFISETKLAIKRKIDNIEKLNSEDIETLASMINSIHNTLQSINSKVDKNSCPKCKNVYPDSSSYCNICGFKVSESKLG